jgi:hypothetical protein
MRRAVRRKNVFIYIAIMIKLKSPVGQQSLWKNTTKIGNSINKSTANIKTGHWCGENVVIQYNVMCVWTVECEANYHQNIPSIDSKRKVT